MRPRYPKVFETSADVAVAHVGEWSLECKADRLLLVVPGSIDDHKGRRYRRVCRVAEEVLGSELLEMFEADAWPVTQLFGHTSTVFVGKFSSTVLARAVRREPQLNRWLYSNDLPEDLCLFRANASMPRFASVTHESDAYYFSRQAPSFVAHADVADGIGQSVPVGRYFCSVPKA